MLDTVLTQAFCSITMKSNHYCHFDLNRDMAGDKFISKQNNFHHKNCIQIRSRATNQLQEHQFIDMLKKLCFTALAYKATNHIIV